VAGDSVSSPVSTGSYVGGNRRLHTFDAAGVLNCSGGACSPLWSSEELEQPFTGTVNSPAVWNRRVYVTTHTGGLHVLDAGGVEGCAGTPTTCVPLWSAPMASSYTTPAVADGKVFVAGNDGTLRVFDANGRINCSGTPTTCSPLWSAPIGGRLWSPAVAGGTVYVGSYQHDALYAYDAAGITNCSGTPAICSPLWSAPTGGAAGTPSVANGVVYVGSADHNVYAFDAAGTVNCSGAPRKCAPLWTGATGGAIICPPAISDGVLFVAPRDDHLYAFELERTPPATSVLAPSAGATLTGTALLTADASDDVEVSAVGFLLSGPEGVVAAGLATPTGSGWHLEWDTASVVNGSYVLSSVAFDPAGNVGTSAGVAIEVAN
jgi:outer membrane protein assembly factor BamB